MEKEISWKVGQTKEGESIRGEVARLGLYGRDPRQAGRRGEAVPAGRHGPRRRLHVLRRLLANCVICALDSHPWHSWRRYALVIEAWALMAAKRWPDELARIYLQTELNKLQTNDVSMTFGSGAGR